MFHNQFVEDIHTHTHIFSLVPELPRDGDSTKQHQMFHYWFIADMEGGKFIYSTFICVDLDGKSKNGNTEHVNRKSIKLTISQSHDGIKMFSEPSKFLSRNNNDPGC